MEQPVNIQSDGTLPEPADRIASGKCVQDTGNKKLLEGAMALEAALRENPKIPVDDLLIIQERRIYSVRELHLRRTKVST